MICNCRIVPAMQMALQVVLPDDPDLPKDPSCRKGLFLRVFFLSKEESFFDKNKSLFLIKIRVFFFY